MRVKFCGAVSGSVTVRRGETPEQALERAQETLLRLLDGAKSLGNSDGHGPNIGLEIEE